MVEMLKFLIEKGADITAKAPFSEDGKEKTALEMAHIKFSRLKWKQYGDIIAILEEAEEKLNRQQAKKCVSYPVLQNPNTLEGRGCRNS